MATPIKKTNELEKPEPVEESFTYPGIGADRYGEDPNKKPLPPLHPLDVYKYDGE